MLRTETTKKHKKYTAANYGINRKKYDYKEPLQNDGRIAIGFAPSCLK